MTRFTPSGEPVVAQRELVNGQLSVVGFYDLQKYINSFESSCDINNIIAAFNSGDFSVLNVNKPLYGDFSNLPDNLAAYLDAYRQGNKFFESLAPDLKKHFDTFEHFNEFMNSDHTVVDKIDNVDEDIKIVGGDKIES